MTHKLNGKYTRIYRSPSNLNLREEAIFKYFLEKYNTSVSLSLHPYSGPDLDIGPGEMNPETIFEIDLEIMTEIKELENEDGWNIEDIIKTQLSPIADAFACTTLKNLHPLFIQERSHEYVKFTTASGEKAYLSLKGGEGTARVSHTISLQNIENSYASLVKALGRSYLEESKAGFQLFLSSLEAKYPVEKFLLGYAAFEQVINSLHKSLKRVNVLQENYDNLLSLVSSEKDIALKKRLVEYLNNKKSNMVNPAILEKFQSIVKNYNGDDNEIIIFGKIVKIRNAILHGRQADISEVLLYTNQDFSLDEDNPILSLWYLFKKYSNLILDLKAKS